MDTLPRKRKKEGGGVKYFILFLKLRIYICNQIRLGKVYMYCFYPRSLFEGFIRRKKSILKMVDGGKEMDEDWIVWGRGGIWKEWDREGKGKERRGGVVN